MEDNILRAYLRLCFEPGFGTYRLAVLLQQWGSLAGITRALQKEAQQNNSAYITALLNAQSGNLTSVDDDVDRVVRWSQQNAYHIICFEDRNYPFLLRQIARPPPLLYGIGNCSLLDQASCAIVGSRAASPYGDRHARWFAHDLGELGFTVVSGLAKGIDASAHRGALQAGGSTIAVLGTGLDSVYPRAHQALSKEIENAGLLLTEFPLGSPARAEHFPQRNRIIAGLSLGTVVIEGSLRSGSLITAKLAMEQGRDVFALPGPTSNRNSRGCHKLIKDGAMLVETPTEVAQRLLAHWHHSSEQKPSRLDQGMEAFTGEEPRLTESEAQVIAALTEPAVLMDQLLASTGMTITNLNASLLQLELKGLVSQEGGRVTRL